MCRMCWAEVPTMARERLHDCVLNKDGKRFDDYLEAVLGYVNRLHGIDPTDEQAMLMDLAGILR